MTDLHLIISRPEPGEWYGRLDVTEALEAADWTGDPDMPLSILRHPSGAVWSVWNESDDSGLECPNGAVIEFPGSTPTVVIVAACLAAAAADGAEPAVEASESCGKCRKPFDPADTRFDGHARFYLTPYCRGCVDLCHDNESADHRCVICA